MLQFLCLVIWLTGEQAVVWTADSRASSRSGSEIITRLFSNPSFRSWSSTMKRFSMSQQGINADTLLSSSFKPGRCSPGPVTIVSRDPSSSKKIVTPRAAPIAGINMTTSLSPSIVGSGPNSIWATVDISVEVASSGPQNCGIDRKSVV